MAEARGPSTPRDGPWRTAFPSPIRLAATPRAEILKVWTQDPCTSTEDDLDAPGHHTDAPPATAASGHWQGRLTGIASEWSARFPGYVAGAIEAAGAGVEALIRGWSALR